MIVNRIKDDWRRAGLFSKSVTSLAAVFVTLFVIGPFLPFSLNYTASMPQGLYYTYKCSPKMGDIIQFKPSEAIWKFALDRGYALPYM